MSSYNKFESQKELSRKRLNGFVIIIVIMLYTLYMFRTNAGASATIACDGSGYGISATTGDQYILYFSDCRSVELLDSFDEGTCVDGVTDQNLHFGTFSNDTDGTYQLCINPKLDLYIRYVTMDGDIYILNYESDDTTRTLYESAADKVS